jgi:hypothetical protein
VIVKRRRRMKVEIRPVVSALQAAIDDQWQHVEELEIDYDTGYVDGLTRALNIVQVKAHGLTTALETMPKRT